MAGTQYIVYDAVHFKWKILHPLRLCVAKKNFGICDSVEAYFYDCRTQCESMRFAKQYNLHNPPKKVAFLQSSVIEVMDDPEKTEDVEFFCLESFLHGSYISLVLHLGALSLSKCMYSASAMNE